MNLSGKWKIRTKVNEITGRVSYRTILTAKDMEGNNEYHAIFLSLVGEAKNKPIDDGTYIIVKPENAWLSFYRKDDKDELTAIVKDFDYEETQETPTFTSDSEDDLPF